VDAFISALLPQMPVVAVLLLVGMVIRADVNRHLVYLETLVDTLIKVLTDTDK